MIESGVRLTTRLALGLAVLALAVPAGRAQGMGMGDGSPRERLRGVQQRWLGAGQWWNNPEMVEQLGLDEESRQRIDDEVYRTQQELIMLRAEVERANLDLQRTLEATETPDLDRVEAQVDRFVDARGDVLRSEILLRAKIMQILTPEQRLRLEEIHQERRRAFRERALGARRRGPGKEEPATPEPGPPDGPPPLP